MWPNFEEGKKFAYLEYAAENGHQKAQKYMGDIYKNGLFGKPKNDPDALRYYCNAAKSGNVEAMYICGEYCAEKIGTHAGGIVQKDMQSAIAWYHDAATQGHRDARYKLGIIYANGDGVPIDREMAKRYWSSLAEEGHEEAKSALVKLEKGPQKNNKFMRIVAPVLAAISLILLIMHESASGSGIGDMILGFLVTCAPFLFIYFASSIGVRIGCSTPFVLLLVFAGFSDKNFSGMSIGDKTTFIMFVTFYLVSCVIAWIYPKEKF